MQQPKSDSYPHIWQIRYKALVRRLVEIADNPSATERMMDYDRVARAHEERHTEENDDALSSPLG